MLVFLFDESLKRDYPKLNQMNRQKYFKDFTYIFLNYFKENLFSLHKKSNLKTETNKPNKPIYFKALPRIQILPEKPALTGVMPYSGPV